MERMSIKAYAGKNKLSMFNVVKMIKTGELQSETVEENGKEVTYVLVDSTVKQKHLHRDTQSASESLEEKVARLESDVAILKRELDALKMSIGIRK